MSDSDSFVTDDLLRIPPGLFIVYSSDSDDSSTSSYHKSSKSGVVSELIDHVQSLESRIQAIESKDSLHESLSQVLCLEPVVNCRQTLPRTTNAVSQYCHLQKTPTNYPASSSLPSSPCFRHQSIHTNDMHHSPASKSYGNSGSSYSYSNNIALQSKSSLHAGYGHPCKKELSLLNTRDKVSFQCSKSLPALNSSNLLVDQITSNLKQRSRDMSITQAEEFLRIRETPNSLTSKNGVGIHAPLQSHEQKKLSEIASYQADREDMFKRKSNEHTKKKFAPNGHNVMQDLTYLSDYEKGKDMSDFTFPNDSSFSSLDTDKFNAEFKPSTPIFQHEFNDSKISFSEHKNFAGSERSIQANSLGQNETDFHNLDDTKEKSLKQQYKGANSISKFTDEFVKPRPVSSAATENNQGNYSTGYKSSPIIFKEPNNQFEVTTKFAELSNHRQSISNAAESNPLVTPSSLKQRSTRPQRFLALSDFWSHDSNKTQEERLRIKLEEEKFRREHCEQIIQDLQKKLLEYQEKVGVAVRVDTEKNAMISQFQGSWKKLKQKLHETESERDNLQKILKNVSEKHQLQITDSQGQIKSHKDEMSKALDLATGYKEKSDNLVREKVEMLQKHADELQNYKSLVQQAEHRYKQVTLEFQELTEKNRKTEDTLKLVQEDLNKELLKSGEVRAEMSVIHKALDSCETELSILRQEKENLQLKLKEEIQRNNILDQAKLSLTTALEEARNDKKTVKNELNAMVEHQDKLRAELRDVYQKQVDEVVKSKLQEFQTQLDSAEMVFQNEIEAKQRAIAECAARKIKSVIDKHQLEINLLEEKHKEERKLVEIKLAQALQRSSVLESQLNSYRKIKNQLVEQIHAMMQKQWQEALAIISRGNGENVPSIPKINVEKFFEFSNDINLDVLPKHSSTFQSDLARLTSQNNPNAPNAHNKQENHNESLVTLTSHDDIPLSSKRDMKNDLKRYVKMILDAQQCKEDGNKPRFFSHSPPSSQKESPNKKIGQKENTSNEGNSSWQPVSEISVHDTSEYLSVPQKLGFKNDLLKYKPPWK